EIRRVTLMNLGPQAREIELTSYCELVLAPAAADAAHPAFSNLFVQTESVPELDTLLATRRPRAAGDPRVWAAHVAIVEGLQGSGAQHETERGRFLGRGRGIRTPMSVIDGRPLSNTTGPPALWAPRTSGDLPIVLVRIDEPEDAEIVRQLLRAHEYWRLKGLAVDLVILNEKATSYPQDLQGLLEALVRTSQSAVRHEDATRGNVFILRGDLVSARDHDLLRTAARAVLLSRHGTLR